MSHVSIIIEFTVDSSEGNAILADQTSNQYVWAA
jgi:hypothetical protein